MGRALSIVALVGLLMATGVAGADITRETRLPIQATPPTTDGVDGERVTVRPGDHLWKISERHLGVHAPEQRVAPYWLEVIEVNEPHLRSGNPDLIYPGEVVRLPAVTEQP